MLLAVFLAMSAYGHRYDVLLQRRSSMRGSLIALHVLSKMIKRNRSKNKIQEVDVEKLIVHQESNTQPGQVANEETLARRKVALDHFMGKDKKDLEPAKSLLWGFETLPSAQRILKEVYENVDGDSNVQSQESTAPSFCTMLLARFIQEHEILELYFINDRWLTRVHRSVIFLSRISIKVSIVGTFFIIKENSTGFWDTFAAIFTGFVANKILGGFIKFLFVLMAKKRRTYTLNKYIRKKNSAKKKKNLPAHERHRNEHQILTLKLEETIDSDKHWTATKLSENVCCCGCTKSILCLDFLSALVWLVALGSIGFCLFFGVMFAFALKNETLAAAWLESVVGSIVFWLFVSKPIVILIKTTIANCKANKKAEKKKKETVLEMTVINRSVAGVAAAAGSTGTGGKYLSFRSDIETGSKQRNAVAEVVVL